MSKCVYGVNARRVYDEKLKRAITTIEYGNTRVRIGYCYTLHTCAMGNYIARVYEQNIDTGVVSTIEKEFMVYAKPQSAEFWKEFMKSIGVVRL